VPTQNLLWQAIGTDMSTCNMEVDKLITSMVLDRVAISQIAFQSSSTDLVTISNSKITTRLNGTPKKALISDTAIADFRPGAFAYGRSDEVVCTRCAFRRRRPRCPAHGDHVIRSMTTRAAHELDGAVGYVF
jgi:hypothetical protein